MINKLNVEKVWTKLGPWVINNLKPKFECESSYFFNLIKKIYNKIVK